MPKGWYDVTAAPYGAIGDGATDDTAAVQAALTACKAAGGGTVYFPPGTYKITSSLSMNQAFGWRITGAGDSQQLNTGPAALQWTGGAGSGPMLKCYSSTNFEIDHLRFKYTNAAYNGDLIDIDGGASGVPAADCQDWHIHHISTRGDAGGLQYTSARSAIRLNKAIIGTIDHSQLTGATNPLRLGDPGGSYVVGVQIENCTFNYGGDAMILVGSADLEAVTIDGCTFEAGNNTPAIRGATTAGDGGQNLIYNLNVLNCWFGDASAPFSWVKDLHSTAGKPIVFQGNRFATNGSTSTPHITGDGIFLLLGNSFEGGDIFGYSSGGASSTTVLMIGNQAVVRKKINNPSTSVQLVELGNVFAYNGTFTQTTDNTQYDRVGGNRLGIGGLAKPAALDGGVSTDEDLVLGAAANAGFGALGRKAGVYYGKTPNPAGLESLILQAPWTGSGGGAGLVAYDSTAAVYKEVVEAQAGTANKLGFFAAAPVVKPTVTGSRGANAALASLITALANLGLLTDSST